MTRDIFDPESMIGVSLDEFTGVFGAGEMIACYDVTGEELWLWAGRFQLVVLDGVAIGVSWE